MDRIYDVTALGELLIDFAENGKSNQGNSMFEACPGGAPCNVLAMLQNLGRKTTFIGKVGADSFGEMLVDIVATVGIETKGIVKDEKVHTTLALIHTGKDGERQFSFYRNPGADMCLKETEVNYEMIRQSKVFHFGTLSMTDEPVRSATKQALQVAKEVGCIITFDPNLREPLWSALKEAKKQMEYGFEYCDVLKISDNEIQFVTECEDYDEGIHKLQERYNIPLILLTMGKNGSRAYYKGIRVEREGYAVHTIETTGAGDTFCGCCIDSVLQYGLDNLTEESLSQMLDFANAAAALVTTKKGALRAMPTKEEVDIFLQNIRS